MRILRKTPRLNYIPGDILMHLFSFQKILCGKGTVIMQKNGFHAKKQKLFSNRICILFPTLESGINVGTRLLIFEKI